MLILFVKIYNNNVKISLMLNLPKNPLLSFNLFAVCYFFRFSFYFMTLLQRNATDFLIQKLYSRYYYFFGEKMDECENG